MHYNKYSATFVCYASCSEDGYEARSPNSARSGLVDAGRVERRCGLAVSVGTTTSCWSCSIDIDGGSDGALVKNEARICWSDAERDTPEAPSAAPEPSATSADEEDVAATRLPFASCDAPAVCW